MKTSMAALGHHDWLIILDGRKFLAFENVGGADRPMLRLHLESLAEDEPTRNLGTDRPGRVYESSSGTKISAVEATDWHEAAEREFVAGCTRTLAGLVAEDRVKQAIVVAPARAMAAFRATAGKELRAAVHEEIVADLTKESIADLERRFARTA